MGIPGSGKGTQAHRLATQFGYTHISTGNFLRTLAEDSHADPDDLAKLDAMRAGGLVDNELIYKVAFHAIEASFAEGKGVVLDGAIRSVEQAERYQDFFAGKGLASDVVVCEIAISDEESLARLTTRLAYAVRGEVVPALATSSVGGAIESARADDDREVVEKRLEEQGNRAIAPILSYYDGLGLLVRIDGAKTIDEVANEIDRLLNV